MEGLFCLANFPVLSVLLVSKIVKAFMKTRDHREQVISVRAATRIRWLPCRPRFGRFPIVKEPHKTIKTTAHSRQGSTKTPAHNLTYKMTPTTDFWAPSPNIRERRCSSFPPDSTAHAYVTAASQHDHYPHIGPDDARLGAYSANLLTITSYAGNSP